MSRHLPACPAPVMNARTVITAAALTAAALTAAALTGCGGPGPDSAACKADLAADYSAALANGGHGTISASAKAQAQAACRGLPASQLRQFAGDAIAGHLRPAAPSAASPPQLTIAEAAALAGCTNAHPEASSPGDPPGTTDGYCTQANGQQAEISTFTSPARQAAFVRHATAAGATVIAQGNGWVLT